MANQNTSLDDNAYPTLLGASGTADTAETRKITAESVAGSVALHVYDLASGAAAGTVNNIATGTLQTLGTVGTVIGIGTLSNVGALPQISVGTIPTVTLDNYGTNVNIVTGTQQTLGTVGTVNGIGTLTNVGSVTNIGTVAVIQAIQDGDLNSIAVVTSVGNIESLGTVGTVIGIGTQTNLGSVTNVGMIHAGTHVHPSGTVTTIVAGTQNTLGTVGVVNNITNGTIKIDQNPTQLGTPYHFRGTSGEGTWLSVLAAAGAGTSTFVSHVDIVVASGTVDTALSGVGNTGSTGANVLGRGRFVASAGLTKPINPTFRSNANGTISLWMDGAGTVDVWLNYWQGV